MKTIAIVFAGGKGTRLSHKDGPKQFVEVGGKTIIAWTLDLFQQSPAIDSIYVVSIESHLEKMKRIVTDGHFYKVRTVIPGGQYAMESIHLGLLAAAADGLAADTIVLIHDGVRPIISSSLIDSIVHSVETHGSGVTSAAAFETLAASLDGGATIASVTNRSEMYTLQAPQAFRLGPILEAHSSGIALSIHDKVIDQAHLIDSLPAESLHPTLTRLALVEGVRGNIKITTIDDINYFDFLLESGKYREIVKS
jgi:2-C-methyl-D-erythritol 4-phosphate cytidylyltransferase